VVGDAAGDGVADVVEAGLNHSLTFLSLHNHDRRRGGSVNRGRLRANCPSIDVVPSRLNGRETIRMSRLMSRRTIRERDERWWRRRD